MKVLVTGGAGYIGSHTVQELLKQNYEVVIVDIIDLQHRDALPGVSFYQGDILDKDFLNGVFQKERVEAVIHFAALKAPGESMREPAKYFYNNITGTVSLLEVMIRNDVRTIVFSSSCAIFGNPQRLPVSEDIPFSPESVYGETKLMGETVLKWFDKTAGIKYSALRYFNAAGASLDNSIGEDWSHTENLIPITMKAAMGVTPSISIFGSDYNTPDGTAIRDYIHVVDLAVAHVKALEHTVQTRASSTYNLGTGKGNTVREVVEAVKAVSGRDFKVIEAPRRLGDPAAIWADCSKAERELGWKAQYSLDTIIQSAWKWHSTHSS